MGGCFSAGDDRGASLEVSAVARLGFSDCDPSDGSLRARVRRRLGVTISAGGSTSCTSITGSLSSSRGDGSGAGADAPLADGFAGASEAERCLSFWDASAELGRFSVSSILSAAVSRQARSHALAAIDTPLVVGKHIPVDLVQLSDSRLDSCQLCRDESACELMDGDGQPQLRFKEAARQGQAEEENEGNKGPPTAPSI